MAGYFRVISFRGDPENGPEPDEVVIDMERIHADRDHAVLANRHHMKSKNDPRERARVIAANKADLDDDLAVKGPMYQALWRVAERVAAGEKICGRCWCSPLPCHLDNYTPVINRMVLNIRNNPSQAAQATESDPQEKSPKGFRNLRR